MKDRIILLIKAKNLTAAQFADEIGVQKSSISHIISGRNNASLDFIQKVLLCYPEVSMDWLMFGKGPIFKSINSYANASSDGHLNDVSAQSLPPVDLFSELNPGKPAEFRKENDLNPESISEQNIKLEDRVIESSFPLKENTGSTLSNPVEIRELKMVSPGQKNSFTKNILKIVEFYSDNTYREYFPE